MADAKVVKWAKKQLAKDHEKPLFLSVGIYRPHVPWYVPQKYFDRFPLDSIQLPKYFDQDVTDLPEAAQKLTKRRWHEWIVANKQWERAVQGYLASLSFADDMIGELLAALDNGPLATTRPSFSGETMATIWVKKNTGKSSHCGKIQRVYH